MDRDKLIETLAYAYCVGDLARADRCTAELGKPTQQEARRILELLKRDDFGYDAEVVKKILKERLP